MASDGRKISGAGPRGETGSGRGEGSSIAINGDSFIQCVTLDDSAPTFEPTLIKMDIEGAEMDALQGAERTISKYKPGLAISIYHKPEHLWELPLWIANFSRKQRINYQYFLCSHARNSFDTIFYAFPI